MFKNNIIQQPGEHCRVTIQPQANGKGSDFDASIELKVELKEIISTNTIGSLLWLI